MPLSTRIYHDKVVRPYLWGLLPEDPAVRRSVAARATISPNNPFALLGVIGLDCPGAVQFCVPNYEIPHEEQLTPLSNAKIAHRLSNGRTVQPQWITESEHWSLGGQQNKFALRKQNGKWFSCEGSAATNHIFKSGVQGLAHQALNEYVCMKLAAKWLRNAIWSRLELPLMVVPI
jgi:serine/threonine-protein kinase HipA